MKLKFLISIMLSVSIYGSALSQKVVRVACVGDSITFGVGVEDKDEDSYPAQLAKLLGEGYSLERFGLSGATLLNNGHNPYIKTEAYAAALAYAPDVAVIHLGVNDTDPRNWPYFSEEFVGDYIGIIESFRKVNPDVRILIAKITPITHRHPRFSAGTLQWQEAIRDAIEQVAEAADVELIDFYEPLSRFPQMLPDAIHPNEQGAAVMANVAAQAITGDYGGLQMPILYSDNMVIQRDKAIEISGVADAGKRVELTVGGKKYKCVAALNGEWSVTIAPLKVGKPFAMSVESDGKTLTYKNILAGDVWLCSGQSNMSFPLRASANGDKYIAEAANKNIRLFNMTCALPLEGIAWSEEQLEAANAVEAFGAVQWQELSAQSAANFSAVAYHFAKSLELEAGVPIGLIANAVGGSPIESWIDRRTLSRRYPMILKDLNQNHFSQAWVRERAAQHMANKSIEQQRHIYEPAYLYESGITPLESYPIKGVIWYQGESNAHNVETHEDLFKLLASSWRDNWGCNELPIYYVQLSSLNRTSWPSFRDSQRRLMEEIPHTGMAVSSDRGDESDVHPARKRDVGERLARWALSESYERDITPSGPLLSSVERRGSSVVVEFDYADALRSSDGKPLRTFELATYDGVYYDAEATIKGDKIIVKSKDVASPRYIRYGWQPFTDANLVNGENLPASTFKSTVDNK